MRLLLVHHDPLHLTTLAQALRESGLSVAVASNAAMGLERATLGEYDAVVVSRQLAEMTEDGLGLVDTLALSLALAPPVLVLAPGDSPPAVTELREDDPGAILARVRDLPPVSRARTSFMTAQFSLNRTPIAALLAAFSDERRSGTLAITAAPTDPRSRAPSSAPSAPAPALGSRAARFRAIVCLSNGQLVDALFGHHQGEKALARLVAMADGVTSFTPGDPDVLPRLSEPTTSLLDRACERAAALALLASRFDEPLGLVRYLRSSRIDDSDERGLASRVLGLLRGPTSVEELLDQLPQPDTEILAALLGLEATGHVRRVLASGDQAPIAAAADLPELRAQVATPTSRGFTGPARLVLAGSPHELAFLGGLALRISEATRPDDLPPTLPLPHVMAELRLGEGVSVAVVALPTLPAYAPLWPMALAGAHAVVALDREAHALLTRSDSEALTATHLADDLASPWPGTDAKPEDLARLLRAALETPRG